MGASSLTRLVALGARYLAVARAAHHEIARLQGLYLPVPPVEPVVNCKINIDTIPFGPEHEETARRNYEQMYGSPPPVGHRFFPNPYGMEFDWPNPPEERPTEPATSPISTGRPATPTESTADPTSAAPQKNETPAKSATLHNETPTSRAESTGLRSYSLSVPLSPPSHQRPASSPARNRNIGKIGTQFTKSTKPIKQHPTVPPRHPTPTSARPKPAQAAFAATDQPTARALTGGRAAPLLDTWLAASYTSLTLGSTTNTRKHGSAAPLSCWKRGRG